MPLVARLAERLGLPGNPPGAVDAARDKHATREVLAAAGLPTPRNFLITSPRQLAAAADAVRFPAVIKPICGAASIGVVRVDDFEHLQVRAAALLGAHVWGGGGSVHAWGSGGSRVLWLVHRPMNAPWGPLPWPPVPRNLWEVPLPPAAAFLTSRTLLLALPPCPRCSKSTPRCGRTLAGPGWWPGRCSRAATV